MKFFVLSSIFLISGTIANACPELAGKYRCYSSTRNYNMNVEQAPVGEYTQYWFIDPRTPDYRDDTTITDGIARPGNDSQTVKNKTIKGWCEGEKLLNIRTGDLYNEGELWSKFELHSTFYLKDKNLIWNEEGQMTFPVNRTVLCKPRN